MHGCRSALAMTAAAMALAGAVVTGPATAAAPHQAPEASRVPPPRLESALLAEMNRVRVERGRRPLRSAATLRRPARGQSRYLLGIGALDHDGPDGSPFWTRLLAAGFPRGRSLGENLAMVPGCGPEVAARTVVANPHPRVTGFGMGGEERFGHASDYARAFAAMPRGAVVLNPGRGALIDDAALVAALDSGRLGHATLDVFRQEPLPPEHPFWAHPKVTVTPHIASETRPETAAEAVAENIRRGEAGLPFLHLVDRAQGY